MPVNFPAVLFSTVSALCFALALAEWRARRRLAWTAFAIGTFAALCFASDRAAARSSIRVDLLLTIPLMSLAAAAAGALSIRRPPTAARVIGVPLVVGGTICFAWFAWTMAGSIAEARRVRATFDEGNRLYWSETIRCEANFEKRFGPMRRRDQRCYGNLVVASRSPDAYPYTRVVVNDDANAYLLFSPHEGMEATAGLRDGGFIQLEHASDGSLSGGGDLGVGSTQILLRPAASGRCEATIARGGSISILNLEQKVIPLCDNPANPPVHYVGSWGVIAPAPGSATKYDRLIQIWLWDASGQARGVLLNDLARRGTRRDFNFARQFRGTQTSPDRWNLRLQNPNAADGGGESLTLTLSGGTATLAGPESIAGSSREAVLNRGAVLTDPRIELVPVRDRALFDRYSEKALFNLNVPWIAP
jgi:hypothetical protein